MERRISTPLETWKEGMALAVRCFLDQVKEEVLQEPDVRLDSILISYVPDAPKSILVNR